MPPLFRTWFAALALLVADPLAGQDDTTGREAVHALAGALRDHYVFPETGERCATSLLRMLEEGRLPLGDPHALATPPASGGPSRQQRPAPARRLPAGRSAFDRGAGGARTDGDRHGRPALQPRVRARGAARRERRLPEADRFPRPVRRRGHGERGDVLPGPRRCGRDRPAPQRRRQRGDGQADGQLAAPAEDCAVGHLLAARRRDHPGPDRHLDSGAPEDRVPGRGSDQRVHLLRRRGPRLRPAGRRSGPDRR